MAKYDKKAALKIMIEAVKQYEEKLNDKQFLIIYRERKDIKTVNVGFRDMNFLHMIIPELSEPPVRTLGATIPENESHIFR